MPWFVGAHRKSSLNLGPIKPQFHGSQEHLSRENSKYFDTKFVFSSSHFSDVSWMTFIQLEV